MNHGPSMIKTNTRNMKRLLWKRTGKLTERKSMLPSPAAVLNIIFFSILSISTIVLTKRNVEKRSEVKNTYLNVAQKKNRKKIVAVRTV